MDQEDRIEVYTIPPNFAEEGTLFSGRVKTRNAVETAMLLMALVPLLFSLDTTVKIKMYIGMIVLVPVVVLSVIGIQGESLFAFIASFFRYVRRRRRLTEPDERYRLELNRRKEKIRKGGKRKREKRGKTKRRQTGKGAEAEGGTKSRKDSEPGVEKELKKDKENFKAGDEPKKKEPETGKNPGMPEPVRKEGSQADRHDLPFTRASREIPIKEIRDGVIHTTDGRYVKILEVMPINFLHRSASEQKGIIYSFMGYLKIAPPELQIKSLSKKADISQYIKTIREDIEKEPDERCRMLQQDYANLICSVGYKEAVTRRFFLVFQADSRRGTEKEIVNTLESYAQTAKKYLYQCGNEILLSDNHTEETAEILYTLLNRQTSTTLPFSERLNQVVGWYIRENGEESVEWIPAAEYIAPRTLDFRHGNCVVLDGVYHTYLFVPSARYRSRVPAGWMSLLV